MARFSKLAVGLLMVSLASVACTNPAKRRAWHTLSNDEKQVYIQAELCLMELPAKLSFPAARTRFDELQVIHQLQAYATHFVVSEDEAISGTTKLSCPLTCFLCVRGRPRRRGWAGESKFMDLLAFFVPFTFTFSSGFLHLFGNPLLAIRSPRAMVVLASRSFGSLEGDRSKGYLLTLSMLNGVSSPGDPLFYLHNTWLDKVFWDWQARDRSTRTTTIGGTNIAPDAPPGFPTRPSNIPLPAGADGNPGKTTTLSHVLNMYGNMPNATVGDVLDIQGDFVCYEYVEP
ncbi:hypothetical protein MYCTH_2029356, partial [Thermothelomyces thermophilus ATCC 42464]